MTGVVLIRHPRTTWNDEGRYQGRLDAPLSLLGHEQMASVTRLFAGEDVAAVYSSPLSRALMLAESLAGVTGASVHADDRLAEIALGAWQGLYRHQILQRFPDLMEQWYSQPRLVRFPGGESLEDVRARTSAWLTEVFSAHSGEQNVIAVSHSAAIQVLSASALGLDLNCLHRIRIDNCSITILIGSEAPGTLLSLDDRRALSSSPVPAASGQNLVSWMERRATY
jgi:phosphoserine phosphatase